MYKKASQNGNKSIQAVVNTPWPNSLANRAMHLIKAANKTHPVIIFIIRNRHPNGFNFSKDDMRSMFARLTTNQQAHECLQD